MLHFYKLHGSINWRRRQSALEDVVISHARPSEDEYGDVMIYPSPLKVTEMNGYPYAEMFRQQLATLVREVSDQERVLYFETEYFGGVGAQSAVVYDNGAYLRT